MSWLTRAGGASLLLGGLLAALAACVPPPAAEVTPEVALATCQAEALAELRRRDPAVQAVALGPLGETRVERIYHLDRGYDAMERKLASVGADIARLRPPDPPKQGRRKDDPRPVGDASSPASA